VFGRCSVRISSGTLVVLTGLIIIVIIIIIIIIIIIKLNPGL
jgi:hypothetical protein